MKLRCYCNHCKDVRECDKTAVGYQGERLFYCNDCEMVIGAVHD